MDEIKQILVRHWLTKSKRDLASALKLSSGEEIYLDTAEQLTPDAEEARYPDEELEPTILEFQNAYSIVSALFTFTLSLLPVDVHT